MNELVSIQRRLAAYGCKSAREDVEPFIHETELDSLRYFTAEYFTQLADSFCPHDGN